nr:threonine aldolase [Anaerolineaceae bacterium]
MRQAGFLAAAGIVALDEMVERLKEDHLRAKRLAGLVTNTQGIKVMETPTMTNMVFVNLEDHIPLSSAEIVEELKSHGVLVGATGPKQFRLVTHYWIGDREIEEAIRIFGKVLAKFH